MSSGIDPLAGRAVPDQRVQLRQAAEDLEAVFFRQMLQAMRDAEPASGADEASAGEKMFRAMFDDEIARRAVQQNKHGLADALYRQLSQHLPPEATAAAASSGKAEDSHGGVDQ